MRASSRSCTQPLSTGSDSSAQRRALDVVHVDPAALALEGRELRHQQARQARHALLV